jgi:acyl-CoA hydrolase
MQEERLMENHKLVLPTNLNQYGYLFGGDLLKWVDEYAWIAATLAYPDCNFVTLGMDRVEFKKSVREGTVLKFVVEKMKKGNTSVQYRVYVYRGNSRAPEDLIFSTCVTLVRIDQNGRKTPLPDE